MCSEKQEIAYILKLQLNDILNCQQNNRVFPE